jgi:hypothetical protein
MGVTTWIYTHKTDREEMGYANMCTLRTNMSDGRTNNRHFKNVRLQLQQFKKNEPVRGIHSDK